jgi:hypothetical protein
MGNHVVSRYGNGTQLLFFVEVFNFCALTMRGTTSLGRVAFNVREVLGSTNKEIVRKLRDGGL